MKTVAQVLREEEACQDFIQIVEPFGTNFHMAFKACIMMNRTNVCSFLQNRLKIKCFCRESQYPTVQRVTAETVALEMYLEHAGD